MLVIGIKTGVITLTTGVVRVENTSIFAVFHRYLLAFNLRNEIPTFDFFVLKYTKRICKLHSDWSEFM